MDLLPLGRLAGMPTRGEASSGYLVAHGGQRLLLDAGPGVALMLSRHLDAPLSGVFISHQHTDHLFDLLPIGKMLLTERLRRDPKSLVLSVDESIPRVPLFVPRGALAALRALAALFPVTTHPLLDRAFDIAFDVHEYEPGETAAVGALSLRFELLRHVSANCGIRIEADDTTFAYTGDTGVTPALTALAAGVGTLLSESTLRDTDPSEHGHLSSRDAGRTASDAGVGELVLTHFSTTDPHELQWHRDSAAAEFAGPVSIAQPQVTVTLTRKALA